MSRIFLSRTFTLKSNRNLFLRACRQSQFRSLVIDSKSEDIKRIRNIGIIAHIDAGKTTTTERMLYYSGFTDMMGEVHDGDTVMDYMAQERERGITITSAAITFNWLKHKINLIDTPGHVDFTFEVERALRVLDGAIVILDASAGVEVQTLKVWEQANRYEVPCIIYLNKLDKPAANVDLCLKSIRNKLKIQPLLLQTPIGESKNFTGIIDKVNLNKHVWEQKGLSKNGRNFSTTNLGLKNEESVLSILQDRESLIEEIANLDDAIADKYLSEDSDSLTISDLQGALRRITLKKAAVPVLCGSSYKNVGVQLLMDAVINYLPNPSERKNEFLFSNPEELCALVFKTIHNKKSEPLTFLRVYSGSLKVGQKVYNQNRQISEKIGKLMIPLADDFSDVASITAGNIAVTAGLKDTITGDLLSSSSTATKCDANSKNEALIQVPDPVFFCTIEPPSVGLQKRLDFALQCLQREDPTFQVEVDEAIGQTILMGMGELHIDVIKERIRVEYGVDAYLGPLQVAYRESMDKAAELEHVLDKTISGSRHFVKIGMKIYPCKPEYFQKTVNVVVTKENGLGKIRNDYLKFINTGVKNALNNGPLLSFPVINVGLDLVWLEVGKHTSLSMLTAAASQCITAGFRKGIMHLLEPVMHLSIAVNKGYAGSVLNNLSQKRSQVINMELRQDVELIEALTPLSELKGYSTELRALTSGTCTFTMDFHDYQRMDREEQAKAIEEVTGFAAF
ncbi:hypothetical protein JTE90_015072 [Oedothorax gibbosus]|uniref:Tr-type G domain-containing protein n=1 Tax=Oedothorax gibbosus TaxID=931172 RepID=A0AAV6VQD0_9ARAC|nr:hypothetical protein JTE90_015072 [Oedothorax gibbosus]